MCVLLLGQHQAQADPLSRTTTYAVDALGRRTSLTLDGRTEQWAYRPDGALAGTMDFAGRVTSFGYSLDGELTAIDYPAGTADVSYAYDAVGNVVSMSDGLGVTSYSYDVLGQRLTRTRNGRTVSYAYTANGQIGQVGYWNRGGVQYAHDAAGRLTGLAPWGATATSYTYRSTGLLAGETRPNGANTLYTYDTASRLTGLNGIGYVLDANGNRTQMTDWEGATTYSYDALDRLAQAIYPTATVTYTLDSTGNRLSDGMVSFTYDPSDRIMNPGFVYDTNGNLLADGMATYEYDAANRLIQMTRSGVVTTYGYDGWGNLIQETVNGVTTEFVLDENTAYTRILGEVRSDGGERLYAYGPEGFSAQLAVGGTVEYPLLDGLGSVRQLTDAAGTVILSRSYDAFGNVRFVAGTGGSRLGYTGEMQDSVSGLVYLRARHYHPVLGRFLQRDSFGGSGQRPQSLNRYSYTENNPVNLVDPSGHIAVCFQGSPKYTVGEGSSSIRFCREALREGGYREGGGENDHGPILGYAAVGIGYWEAYRSVFDAHAERPEEPVIIFGYSWGAVTAMNLAWELYGHSDTPNTCPLNPVPIDLLMLFEFEDFGRLAIHETPPNVKSAVNFYAPWADSQPNPTADGVNEIRGATNIPVRRTPDGDDADHFSIINLQAGDRHESDIYTPPEKRHPPEPPVPDAEAELNDNTINRAADYVRQVMMRH